MNNLNKSLISLYFLIGSFYYRKYKYLILIFFIKNFLETILIGSGLIIISNYFSKIEFEIFNINFRYNYFIHYYFILFILVSLFISFLNNIIFKNKRKLNKDLILYLKKKSYNKTNNKKNLNLFSKILYRIQNYPIHLIEFIIYYLLLCYFNLYVALIVLLLLIIISIYNVNISLKLSNIRMDKKINTFDYFEDNKSESSIWSMELLFGRERYQIFLTNIKYFIILILIILIILFSNDLNLNYLLLTYFFGLRMILSFLTSSAIISLSIENYLIFNKLYFKK